jgi:hypothetical protein
MGPATEKIRLATFVCYGTLQQLGMRSAWVNRHQEPAPGDALSDYEWNDLWPLAGLGLPA